MLLLLFPNIGLRAQPADDDLSLIYKEGIKEMKERYKGETVYFANLINNEHYRWFDTTSIPKEYSTDFLKIYEDTSMTEFDFNVLDKGIKTLSLAYLNEHLYNADEAALLKFRKSFITFTSPLFDKEKNSCIICIDFWCGGDCGKIYFLHLERKDTKWLKTKIETKLNN